MAFAAPSIGGATGGPGSLFGDRQHYGGQRPVRDAPVVGQGSDGSERRLREASKAHADLTKQYRQMQTKISSLISLLGSHSPQQVENLDDVMAVVATLTSDSESRGEEITYLQNRVKDLSSELSKSNGRVEDARSKTRSLRRVVRSFEENQQPDPEEIAAGVSRKLKRKYDSEIQSLKQIVQRQSDEIGALQASNNRKRKVDAAEIDTRVEAKVADVNAMYKARISAMEERMASLEDEIEYKANAIDTLEDSNKDSADQIAELKTAVNRAEGRVVECEEEIEATKASSKKWKAEYEQAAATVKVLETEAADREMVLNELQLKLSEVKAQDRAVQTRVDDSRVQLLAEENEDLKKLIVGFEDLMENQSREMAHMHEERTNLIKRAVQISERLSEVTETMDKTVTENEKLTSENEAVKDEFESWVSREDAAFADILENVSELIPDAVGERDTVSKWDVLSSCISVLMTKAKGNGDIMQTDAYQDLRNRYAVMFGYLQSACGMLKKEAGGVQEGENERTALLVECARIGRFIDDSEAAGYSFKGRNLDDPKKLGQAFLDLVSDEQLGESPIAELYALFMCVVRTNEALVRDAEADRHIVQEARTMVAADAEDRARIQELERWRNRHIVVNESLAPIFSKWAEGESTFERMAGAFVKAFEAGDVLINERKVLADTVDEMTQQVDQLQQRVRKNELERVQEREAFCREANTLAEDATRQMREDCEQHERENELLREHVAKLENELQATVQDRDEIAAAAEKKRVSHESNVKSLSEQSKVMRGQIVELQKDLGEKIVECSRVTGELKMAHEKMDSAEEALVHQKEKKTAYKNKLRQEETTSRGILNDLKKRNTVLREQYTGRVELLEDENVELKASLDRATEEVATANEARQKLRLENARVIVQNRTLTVKADNFAQSLLREREVFTAKQNAMVSSFKAQKTEEMSSLTKTIETCSDLLKTLVDAEFHVSPQGRSIGDLMSIVRTELEKRGREQHAFDDYRSFRKLYKLDPRVSVTDVFRKLEEEVTAQATTIRNMEGTNEGLSRSLSRLEGIQRDVDQWTAWSRSMLRNLAVDNTGESASMMRDLLEETLLTAIGHRSIRRKLDTLRAEKKMLKCRRIRDVQRAHDSCASIRPLVIVSIFCRWMRDTAGRHPVRFTEGAVGRPVIPIVSPFD